MMNTKKLAFGESVICISEKNCVQWISSYSLLKTWDEALSPNVSFFRSECRRSVTRKNYSWKSSFKIPGSRYRVSTSNASFGKSSNGGLSKETRHEFRAVLRHGGKVFRALGNRSWIFQGNTTSHSKYERIRITASKPFIMRLKTPKIEHHSLCKFIRVNYIHYYFSETLSTVRSPFSLTCTRGCTRVG